MNKYGKIVVIGYNKYVNVMFVKNGKLIFIRKYYTNEMEEILLDCDKVLREHNFKSAYIALRRSTFSAADAISHIRKSNIKIIYIKDEVPIPHNACRPNKRSKLNG